MTPEVHALAGPYALDALDREERAIFEGHLTGCPDCTAEVRSLRDAAAELSQLTATPPPPQLREDVLAGISRVRPLPPLTDNVIALRRDRFGRSVWQVMAAACALLAILLGAWGYQQHQEAHRNSTAATSSFGSLLRAPDLTVSTGEVGSGRATLLYSQGRQQVALIGHSLPQPPPGKTYQLWMVQPDGSSGPKFVSAGTFVPDANGNVTVAASSPELASTAKMGVSVEPAGGSSQPTDVIATMSL